MDKYPFLVYIGTAVLGRVGGEMMITDPFITNLLHPSKYVQYGVEIFFTIGVLVAGKIWIKWKISREEQLLKPQSPQETLNLQRGLNIYGRFNYFQRISKRRR